MNNFKMHHNNKHFLLEYCKITNEKMIELPQVTLITLREQIFRIKNSSFLFNIFKYGG